jgi:RNA polymerase sigma factor (sigma-70 family)
MTGTQESLVDFFRREGRRLAAFVRGRIEDSVDLEAEDIVQDVFANLLERADPLAEVENLSAYVWRSLRNRVVDALRRRRSTISLDTPLEGEDGLSLKDTIATSEPDALAGLESAEDLAALALALESLDPRERELVRLTEFEGRTFRELSEEWSVPIGTLLSRKSRAVRKLALSMQIEPN